MSIAPFGTTAEGQEILSSSSIPAVIHLESDGAIQKVEIPGPGTYDYPRMFPLNIQEQFEYYRFGRAGKMSEHLELRQQHPEAEEPPLIVLNVTPTP